jgi:hypothetical protein
VKVRRAPPGQPVFIAVVRDNGRRRYHHCHTRSQALAHQPYLIEHVNAYGQVTKRERLEAAQ